MIEQQVRRAVVRILGRDDVVARPERLQDGEGRRLTRRERGGGGASFELSETGFERLPVRIPAAAVDESAGKAPIGCALEGRRQVNRWRDGASLRIDLGAGVDSECF